MGGQGQESSLEGGPGAGGPRDCLRRRGPSSQWATTVGTSGAGPGPEEGEKRYPDLPPVPSATSSGSATQGQGVRGSLG